MRNCMKLSFATVSLVGLLLSVQSAHAQVTAVTQITEVDAIYGPRGQHTGDLVTFKNTVTLPDIFPPDTWTGWDAHLIYPSGTDVTTGSYTHTDGLSGYELWSQRFDIASPALNWGNYVIDTGLKSTSDLITPGYLMWTITTNTVWLTE